jgi:hypothetical protein
MIVIYRYAISKMIEEIIYTFNSLEDIKKFDHK